MADLKVDYQLLNAIESRMSSLVSEFSNIETQTSSYDEALGSSAVVSAMNGFSGDWKHHRSSLLSSMHSLGTMVSETIAQFQKADKKLSSALTEKQ